MGTVMEDTIEERGVERGKDMDTAGPVGMGTVVVGVVVVVEGVEEEDLVGMTGK